MKGNPEFDSELRAAMEGVTAAFEGVAAPEPDRWILPQERPKDQAAADHAAASFIAGAPSRLDQAFWAEHWASLCYCTVEAYRYLLPSLLRCASSAVLQATVDEPRLWSSAVYNLRPSAWSLYWDGRDERFAERLSFLSARQGSAVAAWLGAAMRSPAQEHRAAFALAWGWNEPATPALERAREYYRRMTSYRWPSPQDPEARRLTETVKEAFEDVPAPMADDMTDSMLGDEPSEYALMFRSVDRWSLHPEFISLESASLGFFTPAAFRYFLPAFVIADIHGQSGNANPVFHLTDGLADGAPDEWSAERFSRMSPDERGAIVAYLEWRATKSEYERKNIERALSAFWKRR